MSGAPENRAWGTEKRVFNSWRIKKRVLEDEKFKIENAYA